VDWYIIISIVIIIYILSLFIWMCKKVSLENYRPNSFLVGIHVIALICCGVFTLIFITQNAKDKRYVEIYKINDKQYIRCLDGIQYLMTDNSSTVMLDANNKTISCQVQYFTYQQTKMWTLKSFMSVYK
jgi:hypothetical protein